LAPSSTPTSAGAVTSAATDDLTSVWVTLTAMAVLRSATP